MSDLSWWPAPAKLNLFLHVVRRRPDGYHDLQTLFQLIDRCDRIGIAVRNDDGRIVRTHGLSERDARTRIWPSAQRWACSDIPAIRQGADYRGH